MQTINIDVLVTFELIANKPLADIVLPIFHAFTGCQPTPAFRGKGKNTEWQA